MMKLIHQTINKINLGCSCFSVQVRQIKVQGAFKDELERIKGENTCDDLFGFDEKDIALPQEKSSQSDIEYYNDPKGLSREIYNSKRAGGQGYLLFPRRKLRERSVLRDERCARERRFREQSLSGTNEIPVPARGLLLCRLFGVLSDGNLREGIPQVHFICFADLRLI